MNMKMMYKKIWSSLTGVLCSRTTRLVLASAAAHGNSISVGITQGYSAVLLPQLIGDNYLSVTEEEASWIAALGVISTPVGSLLSGVLVEILGRKRSILSTNVPFLIAWIIIGVAQDIRLLYIGRVLSALAAGMTTSSYLYVAESSTKESRGVLSAFGPVFVSLGVLIVYTLGSFMVWNKVALVATIFSLLSAISMYHIPESPAWYVSRNQDKKALESLKWLRQNKKDAENELQELQKARTENNNNVNSVSNRTNLNPIKFAKTFLQSLTCPTVYKPFFILLLFFLFQEGSGIYIILFYAVQIFQEFGTDYNENLVSVTVGVLRLVMSVLCAYFMTKFGRRQLGIFSGICMTFSMLIVCVYLHLTDFLGDSGRYNIIPLVGVLFHVGFSMAGFLQLPWILASELFPVTHRGVLTGVVFSVAYFLIFITVKVYPTLLHLLQLTGVLWIFSAMSAIGSIFLYFYMPETKDKSLEEISNSFRKDLEGLKCKEEYRQESYLDLRHKTDIEIVLGKA